MTLLPKPTIREIRKRIRELEERETGGSSTACHGALIDELKWVLGELDD